MSYASGMRVAAVLVAVAIGACIPQDRSTGFPDGNYDPNSNPQPGQNGCRKDADCGTGSGLVCARDFACVNASDVYTAHISWTIHGALASAQTCASLPGLDLQFFTSDDYFFGYSPIACDQGKFTITKLPTWYMKVSIHPAGDQGTFTRIDPTTGDAAVDLPY